MATKPPLSLLVVHGVVATASLGGRPQCPVEAAAAFFHRKWMINVLRDVVCHDRHRFHEFLDASQGLSDKVLSRRLKELVDEGILERTGRRKFTRYRLTEKGHRVVPILAAYYNYGIKNRTGHVPADGGCRPLDEVLLAWDARFVSKAFEFGAP